MSAFSECLTSIKNARGLSSAEVAKICETDITVIFRWIKGERLPNNMQKVEEIERKLRLSEQEKRELEEAYIITLCGADKYKSFKEVIKMINNLQISRLNDRTRGIINEQNIWDEYLSKVELDNDYIEKELVTYKRKSDIIDAVMEALLFMSKQEDKKLYIFTNDMDTELEAVIRNYCKYIENSSIEKIIYQGENDNLYENVDFLGKVVNTLFHENDMQLWIGHEKDHITYKNYILSNRFFIQYSDDMSEGMMTTYPELIEMYMSIFQYQKNHSICIGKNGIDGFNYVKEEYDKDSEIFVLENQPCVGACLTEEMLRNHLYKNLPDREEMIQSIIQTYVLGCRSNNGIIKEMNNYFTESGLREFLETGMLEAFPYPVYTPLSLGERCRIIRDCVELSGKGKYRHHYMLRENKLPDLSGIHIEYKKNKSGSKVSVDVNLPEGGLERIRFWYENIVTVFEAFFSCLKNEKYVYSQKETESIMLRIVEEYEKGE